MSNFTNQIKSSSSFSNQTKHPSGLTFADLPMSILDSYVFQNGILADGTTIENVKFTDAVPGELLNAYIAILWSDQTKN